MGLAERFWPKVARGATDECWPFLGYCRPDGYGEIALGTREDGAIRAHRAAWLLTHGAVPDGLCVLHACDVPPCCNPAHLFLGTRGDNTADMMRKGRNRRGPQKVGAVARAAAVTRYLNGGVTQGEIAATCGVSQSTVNYWLKRHRLTIACRA